MVILVAGLQLWAFNVAKIAAAVPQYYLLGHFKTGNSIAKRMDPYI